MWWFLHPGDLHQPEQGVRQLERRLRWNRDVRPVQHRYLQYRDRCVRVDVHTDTCSSLSKGCGTWDDGCGGSVTCGPCSTGTCNTVTGACESVCTPATCGGLSKQCGTWDDGCSGTITCGPCSTGTCNTTTGACETVCTPATCGSLSKQCGTWDDGCSGTVTCGPCSTGTCNTTTGACEAAVCITADGPRCYGDTVQTCPSGQWVDGTDCSGSSQYCIDGACDPATTCTDGDKRCSGHIAERCELNYYSEALDCGARGEVCINGRCAGSAAVGDACAVGHTFPEFHLGAGSCAWDVSCILLDPTPVGISCNTVADCPIVPEFNPVCADNSCAASACTETCGAGRACASGYHAEDVGSTCYCLPSDAADMGEWCNFSNLCDAGLSCIAMAQPHDWGYCSQACTGGDCWNGATCVIQTGATDYCGWVCPGTTSAECPTNWRCVDKGVNDWVCTPP